MILSLEELIEMHGKCSVDKCTYAVLISEIAALRAEVERRDKDMADGIEIVHDATAKNEVLRAEVEEEKLAYSILTSLLQKRFGRGDYKVEDVLLENEHLEAELERVKDDRWCLRGDRMENCAVILTLREKADALEKVVGEASEAVRKYDGMFGENHFSVKLKRILSGAKE